MWKILSIFANFLIKDLIGGAEGAALVKGLFGEMNKIKAPVNLVNSILSGSYLKNYIRKMVKSNIRNYVQNSQFTPIFEREMKKRTNNINLQYSYVNFEKMKRDILTKIKKNPKKVWESILTMDDQWKDQFSTTINKMAKNGEQIEFGNSFIDYAIWTPITNNNYFGAVTCSFKGRIYTFGVGGFSRKYPMVSKPTWIMLKYSMKAGKTWWNTYYGRTSLLTGRIKHWKGPS